MINRFPHLTHYYQMNSKVAVPCERLFTSAGYIVIKTCSSLESNSLLLILCSHACVANYPTTFEQENVWLFTVFYLNF